MLSIWRIFLKHCTQKQNNRIGDALGGISKRTVVFIEREGRNTKMQESKFFKIIYFLILMLKTNAVNLKNLEYFTNNRAFYLNAVKLSSIFSDNYVPNNDNKHK